MTINIANKTLAFVKENRLVLVTATLIAAGTYVGVKTLTIDAYQRGFNDANLRILEHFTKVV